MSRFTRLSLALLAASLLASASAQVSFPEDRCGGVCPQGWYSVASSSGPDGETRECRLCEDGTFNVAEGSSQCFPCPDGILCRGGLAFVRPNFWPYSFLASAGDPGDGEAVVANPAGTLIVVGTWRCPEGLCVGSPGDGPLRLLGDSNVLEGGEVCAEGRRGFAQNSRCSACAPGLTEWNGLCHACDADSDLPALVAVGVGFLAFVVLLHTLVNSRHLAATALLKIFGLFVASARLTLGPRLYWMSWLGALDFDPVATVSNRSCLFELAAADRMLVESLLPVAFYVVLFVVYALDWLLERAYHHLACASASQHPSFVFAHARYGRTALAGAVLGYTSWVFAAARYVGFTPPDGLVVFYSPGLYAGNDDYRLRLAAPVGVLVVFGLGVPLCAALVALGLRARDYQRLRRASASLEDMSSRVRAFRLRYGVLFEAYHHSAYWFELVVLALRGALVAVAVLLAPWPLWRAQATVVVHVAALVAHATVRPYATPLANTAASATLGVLACAAALLVGHETYEDVPGAVLALVTVAVFVPFAALAALLILRGREVVDAWWNPQHHVVRGLRLERAGNCEVVPAREAGALADDCLVVRPLHSDHAHALAARYRKGGAATVEMGRGGGFGGVDSDSGDDYGSDR